MSKENVQELVHSAVFLNQLANEENLLNELLKQGRKFMQEKDFGEAIKMLLEAYSLDKWKELYGGVILPKLSKKLLKY